MGIVGEISRLHHQSRTTDETGITGWVINDQTISQQTEAAKLALFPRWGSNYRTSSQARYVKLVVMSQ